MISHLPGGDKFSRKVPDGDERHRLVCGDCGWVHYENPKIVVGVVAEWQGKILMCRSNIEPRKGFWTIPAGFMEENETTEQGAAREAWEEAHADLTIVDLLAVYNIPRISQVQLIYRARLNTADVRPGVESMETELMDLADIPRDQLAFPSVTWALDQFTEVHGKTGIAPFSNPPGDLGNM